MLGRAAIERLIPHEGSMCLLDAVETWDEESIRCTSDAHRDPANPLRRGGRLAGACAIELGLQAAALHGALAAGGPQAQGFVTSLAEVEIALGRVEDLPGPLTVEARVLATERRGCAYRFAVADEAGRTVVAGRATIAFPDAAGPDP